MFSAIVSDTLLFKSPTCTDEDVQAGKELAEKAGVNVEEYGLAMLKAGADLSDKSLEDLLSLDAKEYTFGNVKSIVAQVNAVDVNDVLGRKDELVSLLNKNVEENGLNLYFFIITDILNNDSIAVVAGSAAEDAAKAFGKTLKENAVELPGVVSRKKQVVPVLTDALK